MEQSLKGIDNGDLMAAELTSEDRPFRASIILISEEGATERRIKESGIAAVQMLREEGYEIVETMTIPNEPSILKKELIRLADQCCVDLIITSGGTGFSMSDRTPETTMEVADRNAPGIAEYMRVRSMEITDRAMLGRGVSVIRKRTLIINLPGSPKAVRESLDFIVHALDHGLRILRGSASKYSRK